MADSAANLTIPAPGKSGFPIQLLARVDEFVTKQKLLILAVLSGAYLIAALCICLEKRLWFDEYLTLDLAEAKDLPDLFRGLRAGFDLAPPMFHFITHLSVLAFGDGPMGIRLPAVAAFWVMMCCLFRFVSQRYGALAGFIAFMIPPLTQAVFFSTDARPYGPVLGFIGIALVAWQKAIDRTERRIFWLAVFSLAASMAVACHYFACFAVLAFGLAELHRTVRNRRIDWSMWAAISLTVLPIILSFPLIPRDISSQNTAGTETAHPHLIIYFYRDLLTPFLAVAATVLVVVCGGNRWFTRAKDEETLTLHQDETTVAIWLFLSPIPTVIVFDGTSQLLQFAL
jgi:Dolichyl-phosphate-mannose-protein mannosyltransferase